MLKLFDPDKAGHYIAGSAVAATCAMAAIYALRLAALAWAFAFLGAFVAGAVKEVIDALDNRRRKRAGLEPRHNVEGGDLIATTLGAAPVALPLGMLALMAAGIVR